MFPRLLPVRLEGSGPRREIELSVQINPDDLAKRLRSAAYRDLCSGSISQRWSSKRARAMGQDPDKKSNGSDEPIVNHDSLAENGDDE
jgi:hypothetical protein